MIHANKQSGFWGSIQQHTKDINKTKIIWDLIFIRISELYPEKTSDQIIKFLNSLQGRYLANNLNNENITNIASIMLRIALLNRLNINSYWEMFDNIKQNLPDLNKKLVLRTALCTMIQNPDIENNMYRILGCAPGTAYPNPHIWLESEFTTTIELERMWQILHKP